VCAVMLRSRTSFVCFFLLLAGIEEKVALSNFSESRIDTASHHLDDIMGTTINGPSYGYGLQDSRKTLAQTESSNKDKGNHGFLSLSENNILRKYRIPFVISKRALIGIGVVGFCLSLIIALTPLIVVTILIWRPVSKSLTRGDYVRVLASLDKHYALNSDAKMSSSGVSCFVVLDQACGKVADGHIEYCRADSGFLRITFVNYAT
uniref:Uncharacterized protein n=2 Tax=Parascaris univalens TaxID=6257 RepID=A0A914ZXQ0_PARUN